MNDINDISLNMNIKNSLASKISVNDKIISVINNDKYNIFYHNSYSKIESQTLRYLMIEFKNQKNKEGEKDKKAFKFNIKFQEKIKKILYDDGNVVFLCKYPQENFFSSIYKYDIEMDALTFSLLKNRIINLNGFAFFNYNTEYYGIHGGLIITTKNKLFHNYNNNFILINKTDFNIKNLITNNNDLPHFQNHTVMKIKNKFYIYGGKDIKLYKENKNIINKNLYIIENKFDNLIWEKLEFNLPQQFNGMFDYNFTIYDSNIFLYGGFYYINKLININNYLLKLDLNSMDFSIFSIVLDFEELILNLHFDNSNLLFIYTKSKDYLYLKEYYYEFFSKENNKNYKLINKKDNKLEYKKIEYEFNCKDCDKINSKNYKDTSKLYYDQKNSYFYNNYLFKNFNFNSILKNAKGLSLGIVYPFIPFKYLISIFSDSKKNEFILNKNKIKIKISSTENKINIFEILENKNFLEMEKFIKLLSNLYFIGNGFTIKFKDLNENWILYLEINEFEWKYHMNNDFKLNKEPFNIVINFKKFNFSNNYILKDNNIFLANNFIEYPQNLKDYFKLQFYFSNYYIILNSKTIKNKYDFKNNLIIKKLKTYKYIKLIYLSHSKINNNFSFLAIYNNNDFIKFLILDKSEFKEIFQGIIILKDLYWNYYNNRISRGLINQIKKELKEYINSINN